MMGLLDQYAEDHTNWFPKAEGTPLDALRQLYPKYTLNDVDILAGISGDVKATRKSVKEGRPLTEKASSWVYFPGFRSDDGDVAIIWESKAGITMTGERCDGHAVGFANGAYRQISSTDWESFVSAQEKLRSARKSEHSTTDAKN